MKCVIVTLVLVVAGCTLEPRAAAGIDRRGSPKIRQRGGIASPASASVTTSTMSLPVPAGTRIEFEAATPVLTRAAAPATSVISGKARGTSELAPRAIVINKPTSLRIETRREAVEGAKTPEPPSPPSPVEIARGKGVVWFYGAAAICGVAAVVAFVRRYFYAGLCFAAGALALPLGVNLVSSELVVRVAIGLAVAGAVFVAAWKIISSRHALAAE